MRNEKFRQSEAESHSGGLTLIREVIIFIIDGYLKNVEPFESHNFC